MIIFFGKNIWHDSNINLSQNYNKNSNSIRVPIILYHYVEYVKDAKDTIRKSLSITPFVLDQQIKTLKDAGYTFMTASEVADVIDGKSKIPGKPIVLSFDDGYRDFYTDVLPILKKYNVKATLYIIYNFLDQENYLYKWQVDEIIETKLVEIGSHTLNHMYLKGTNQGMVTDEIVTSKSEIEKTFNIKVNSFAYPYGAYNDFAAQQVETSKYTNAVTTDLGIIANKDNLFELKRIRPGYNTNQSLINLIEGLKDN